MTRDVLLYQIVDNAIKELGALGTIQQELLRCYLFSLCNEYSEILEDRLEHPEKVIEVLEWLKTVG